jgi:hypothetical protein
MRLSILPSLALLPVLASADTLVLKNGTTYDGTFVSGTSRRITFVDGATNRQRVFDVTQVQEVAFGSSTTTSAMPRETVVDLSAAVDRLRRDIRESMGKVTLSMEDRRDLNRISETLRTAALDRSDGTVDYVDRRDVRDAIRELQAFLDRGVFRDQDRQMIANDLQQVRELRRATRPEGVRSRTGYSRYR